MKPKLKLQYPPIRCGVRTKNKTSLIDQEPKYPNFIFKQPKKFKTKELERKRIYLEETHFASTGHSLSLFSLTFCISLALPLSLCFCITLALSVCGTQKKKRREKKRKRREEAGKENKRREKKKEEAFMK
jgi:hypothetical protein